MIKNYSLLICVSSDKYYSVELCGEFCSFRIKNEYMKKAASETETALLESYCE